MILVIGAGVAGLSAALAIAAFGSEVQLVTNSTIDFVPGEPAPGNTALAQGGIAAALGRTDSAAQHAQDTETAGVGLVDPEAARIVTTEGAARVRQLIAQGFTVDRAADGSPALGLEAAHGHARIVHAGEDRTGASLYALLCAQVRDLVASGRIQVLQHHTLLELVTREGRVTGATLQHESGLRSSVAANAVVLATGGYAALWERTSNHSESRGSGIVCAARAGAIVSDLEFVQFHPTVLGNTGFLVSEAVRGAGAVLRDDRGDRFMVDLHTEAELAPRDVVSREIHRVLQRDGVSTVWLDATGIERAGGSGTLAKRFPKITAAVRSHGYDWTREVIPVAPAAHYTMGGVATDLAGRTTLPGLFAAGEVSATGVHGANRLASNSLLEGLVFGDRAGRAAVRFIAEHTLDWQLDGIGMQRMISEQNIKTLAVSDQRAHHQAINHDISLDATLGIERTAAGLKQCSQDTALGANAEIALAHMIAEAALARTESRGAHQRADYPQTDPTQARRQGWQITNKNHTLIATQNPRSFAAC